MSIEKFIETDRRRFHSFPTVVRDCADNGADIHADVEIDKDLDDPYRVAYEPFLATEALISEIPEEEKEGGGTPAGFVERALPGLSAFTRGQAGSVMSSVGRTRF